MENISKALLIAAGMLFTIMILSMLMITYNKIASNFQEKHELAIAEQTELFNNEFESYNRSYIRGNDLISLMNKIIDYNASQSYREDIGSKRILVKINLLDVNEDVLNGYFRYTYGTDADYSVSDDLILDQEITNTKLGNKYDADNELIKITGVFNELIIMGQEKLGITLTEEKLQSLSSQIPNIVLDNNNEEDEEQYSKHFKRANLFKNNLGLKVGTTGSASGEEFDIIIDNETGMPFSDQDEDKIEVIKEIACKYYQYTQFKRACFTCAEVKYDVETKRIVEMNFEIQTDDAGYIVSD